ncbi:MAG TPA: toll/interleukin-1 receptor domain-containing protein [Ktedonobacterales bacterium]|nr:toll/interleukin-1 receptor domain-containing protein [Ktedonobacterales bacterium]
MARILALYASQDKPYADACISAAQTYDPSLTFDARDDAGASTLDTSTLAQYMKALAFISPEALNSPAIARALEACAARSDNPLLLVIMRPVELPPFLAMQERLDAETLSPQQIAERLFELLNEFADRSAAYPDDTDNGIVLPPVGEVDELPSDKPAPEPEITAPSAGSSSNEWWEIEEERAAPPPPPPAPEPAPAPKPEQPAAQPPASPPPPAPPASPPPAPGGAPLPPAPPPGSIAGEVGSPITTPPQRSGDRTPQVMETLQFTAFHPNEAPVETSQTLLVYAHLGQHVSQVQRDAGTFTELGSAPAMAQGASQRKIPRNIEITVEPHVEGVTFSPAQDSFIWRGEWHRSLFRYTGGSALAGTALRGRIDIYAERISPICTIEVTFSFHTGIPSTALVVPHGINVTSNLFDRVFISYSHSDQEAMRQARETYEKLGITAYHDDLLESGANYEQRLAEMIRAANIFHLLWSAAAARSPEVRKEWALALSANNAERFIRPWYWQRPFVAPPPELQARKISFRYEHLRRRLFNPSTWF